MSYVVGEKKARWLYPDRTPRRDYHHRDSRSNRGSDLQQPGQDSAARANREHAKSAETLGIEAFLSSSGKVNPTAKNRGYNTFTYTYFVEAGTGVPNFCASWSSDGSGGGSCGAGGDDDRWILDGHYRISTLTNVDSWTTNTTISDDVKLGDEIAKI